MTTTITPLPASTDPEASPPASRAQRISRPDAGDAAADDGHASDVRSADRMLERLAASDYAGALTAAEALLARDPRHEDARECAEMARSELRKLYTSRLGSLDRVPRLAMGLHGLLALPLEFRAGFVLSRVDGRSSVRQIAHESGLPPLDALRLLSELYLQRAIGFEDEHDG